ncbi:MAG: octaprenyl diphosphate synthase, partial [Cellvibrionales bacterium]|nr:octaprenyl diphosphate synthase [Cellvibrionales bacterium]
MQSSYDIVADEFSAVNDLIAKQLTSDVGLVENISQYLV